MLTLIIGGARCGKSRFAQSLGREAERPAYIATARPEDAEMEARIARHREERPPHWITIEEPVEIARAVETYADRCDFVLLDCLTLWLSNLCAARASGLESAARDEIIRLAAASAPTHLVLVTNEVGCGIVPESALGRFFRDLQGRVNQEAARRADAVYQLVAGIPVTIKQGNRL